MPKFFVKQEQINENIVNIIGDDVNHIKNVLRLKIDDKINICNITNGENHISKIINIEKQNIQCSILEKLESNVESNIDINILQGIPKADKMELIIQKSIELGVKEITPVLMKRCITKLDNKNEKNKIERWQKISEIAAKQSGRDIIPKINNVINIENICNIINNYDIVLVAYENEKTNSIKEELKKSKELCKKITNRNIKIAIIVGPEGGIDLEELNLLKNKGAKSITLGKRILRTETVALVITSIIMYELGDMN